MLSDLIVVPLSFLATLVHCLDPSMSINYCLTKVKLLPPALHQTNVLYVHAYSEYAFLHHQFVMHTEVML